MTVPSSKRSNGNKNIGRLRAQARKQALAMAEVRRQENRENLRRATQITVAMDESKYRKDHAFPLRSAKQPHRRELLAPRRRELCSPLTYWCSYRRGTTVGTVEPLLDGWHTWEKPWWLNLHLWGGAADPSTRHPTRPPTPTPPRLLTESCGPSQNRVAPHRIVVYAWLMGTPRKALRTPAQSPSPEKVTTRQKGGAGRNRPRPKSEVSLRGSLWRLAGREIGFSLGGGGSNAGLP